MKREYVPVPGFFMLVFVLSIPFWLVANGYALQLLTGLPLSAMDRSMILDYSALSPYVLQSLSLPLNAWFHMIACLWPNASCGPGITP